jgi:hypothetical protein
MKALVVYESVFGNTAEIARAVAEGLSRHAEVTLADVRGARPEYAERFDLLVAGGPTRAFSMLPAQQRPDAVRQRNGRRPEFGLRDWLRMLPAGDHLEVVATFDTRPEESRWLNGSAARRAAHLLQHLGYQLVADPMSFYAVTPDGPLVKEERSRAREWGDRLGARLVDDVAGYSAGNENLSHLCGRS